MFKMNQQTVALLNSICRSRNCCFHQCYSWSCIFCLFLLCTYYRDSEDAVYGRDGYDYDGYRLRVEFPKSGRGGGGGGGGGGSGGMGPPRSRYGPPSRRSEYRVLVTGG